MGEINKCIKWMEAVRDHAVVTLDHIKEQEPDVSPIIYEGRQRKVEMIIKVLHKQIPQIIEYKMDKMNHYVVFCPVCKSDLSVFIGNRGINYCPNCGQRLN